MLINIKNLLKKVKYKKYLNWVCLPIFSLYI